MRPGDFAAAFVVESLGRVKSSEISLTSGDTWDERLIQHGVREALARFVEKARCLWCHRSRPSARISCISGERSRYAAAGKGLAEITAPVSFRIVVVMWARFPRSW